MRCVFTLAMVLSSAVGFAFDYGEGLITYGGAGVPIHISGFTESPLRIASGTNVQFGISAGPEYYPVPGEFDYSYWRPKDITDMNLKIGTDTVNLLLPAPGNDATWAKVITFQSNHFAHNSVNAVELKVKATFEQVKIEDGSILDTIGPIEETVTVSFNVYNDLLSWHTTVDADGNTNEVSYSYPSVAEEGLTAVRPHFTSMKHHEPDNETLTKSEILNPSPARFLEATGVFAFTRGTTLNVWDSGTNPMSYLEIGDTVVARATNHPHMNFAIYYACSMFAAAQTWFNAHSFSATNCFFAGFAAPVESRLKKGDNSPNLMIPVGEVSDTLYTHLSAHAELYVTELETGMTALSALQIANDQYPPRQEKVWVEEEKCWDYALLPMQLYGDIESTLNCVYGHQEALESIESGDPTVETLETWYITR